MYKADGPNARAQLLSREPTSDCVKAGRREPRVYICIHVRVCIHLALAGEFGPLTEDDRRRGYCSHSSVIRRSERNEYGDSAPRCFFSFEESRRGD